MGGVARAGLYARISQDTDGTGLGVARQLEDCHRLADSLGWPVAGEYVDNDISAYSGKRRPEYQRMLSDIADGVIDAVIVYHLDRLTRRPLELEQFLAVLDQAGVRNVRFVSGPADLSTGDGLLVVRMLAAVAANESASKARRIMRKNDQSAAAGQPHRGSTRPFGYEADFVTINPTEAQIVREVAARYIAGESLRSVATDLNARGIPTVRGSEWRTSTLRNVLVNPRYAGQRVHRGQIVGPGIWEPILSMEDHRRILAVSAEKQRAGRRTPQRYLLSGLLRCSRCGKPMYSSARVNRRRYVCIAGPDHGGCGRMTISAEPVEEILAEAVLYRLDSPDLIAAMTGRDSTDAQTQAVTAEYDAAQARMEELATMYGAGEITKTEWLTAKRPLQQRLEHAALRLARLTKTSALTGLVGNGDQLRASWAELNLSRQHAIVKAVLDHAIIKPGSPRAMVVELDRIEPVWRL
ncbi:recombinase family protein [Nocardioides fonticola]|uniref:Recombinase family protein n=1 Tax=Nocardioides fonticola TaxID=450363 RepID=A0ABP7XWX5_9ACTN